MKLSPLNHIDKALKSYWLLQNTHPPPPNQVVGVGRWVYLVAVSSVGIAEPLDVVEDQPGEGDDHEHDEGDGDEHHRGAAHVLLKVPRSYGDVHVDWNVSLQQGDDLPALGFRDHDGHNFTCACRGNNI